MVALSCLAVLLVLLALISRAGTGYLVRYWGDLQQRYKVVDVSQQDSAQVVELRRTWAFRDRRYVVQCHICEPVEVGTSYHFEPVPGENPPMMKRLRGAGRGSGFLYRD